MTQLAMTQRSTTQRSTTRTAPKSGLFSQMLRLWLEHNQRMLDMRMGPF